MKNLTVLISRVSVFLFMKSGTCLVSTHIVLSTKKHEIIEINTNRNVPFIEAINYINKHGMKMKKSQYGEDLFVAYKDRYEIEKKRRERMYSKKI